jgi:hypothetical protein
MKIIFLLEEISMKETLVNILPQIIPAQISYQLIKHNGKSDLQRSIPVKLRGWREPDVHFVIMHDQDSNDCIQLKKNLSKLARENYRPDTLIRIVCTELESWFLGDIEAIEKAYAQNLTHKKGKAMYRMPDNIKNAKEELRKLITFY